MDYGELGLKVLQVLSPILLAALTWVAAKIAQYIQAKVKNEYLRGVLVRLDDAVLAAVQQFEEQLKQQQQQQEPQRSSAP